MTTLTTALLGGALLLGCAQIVGVGDLPPGGASGSGSSSGSAGGDVTAFVGTWTVSGTTRSTCAAPQPDTGTQVIEAGPGPDQIQVPVSPGCALTFTVTGNTARLDGTPSCSGTSAGTGDALSRQWTAGVATLSSPTSLSLQLGANVTDATTGGSCAVTQDDTLTR